MICQEDSFSSRGRRGRLRSQYGGGPKSRGATKGKVVYFGRFITSLRKLKYLTMGLADSPHKELLREVGWHERGYLPHFDGLATPQSITLHLADAVPLKVIERWQRMLRNLNDEQQLAIIKKRIDHYLDQGYGECYLRNPGIAELVQNSLLKYDGERYRLYAWCVMPNHEHSLIRRGETYELEEIMQAHKSYTAHEANKLLDRQGRFWTPEYHDRMIRNNEHFQNALRYIENNPVRAKLCEKSSDWPFSSAWFRKRGGKPGAWVVPN